MKMGRVAVAMATTLMVMTVSMMQGAEAQAGCLTVSGAGAPFSDATALVQQLQVTPGQCCNNAEDYCNVVLTSGNAAASVCATNSVCPNCADVGNDLNEVLAQCNVLNEVQGEYSIGGTYAEIFYLTSASNVPP